MANLADIPTEELMKMRGAQAPDIASLSTEQLMRLRAGPSPTGSFGENLKAGIGKGMTDVARGAGQRLREALTPTGDVIFKAKGLKSPSNVADLLGLPTQGDIDEAKRTDAPLMATGGGKVGDVLGGAALFAPTAIIPGANTATGAGLVGGLMGLMKPTATGDMSAPANAAIGTATGTLAQLATGKVADAFANRAAKKAAEAAADKTQNATRDAVLEAAQKAGYVVPPSAVKPGLVNETLEGVSGKIATQNAASLNNQKVTDSLAREYLGMPQDSILSKAAIGDAKNIAAEPYRQIAKISPEAKTALESWKQANFDARMQWNYFRKSGNPEAYKAAQAAGDASEKALNDIEAKAAQVYGPAGKDFVESLQAARVRLGKLSTVESAMTSGGHVDANLIAKMGERMKFGDELKLIADFAGNFSKSVKTPEKIGGMAHALRPSIGAAVGTVVGGPVGGAVGAVTGVAAPWTVRQALLSGVGQRALATPSYGAGGAQTIADLLSNPAARAMLPAAGTAAALNYAQ